MTGRSAVHAIVLCSFIGLVGCEPTAPDQVPVNGAEIRPPYAWPETSLASSGLDSVLIDSALSASQAESFLYSLLIVRHGSLAVEYNRQPLTQFNDYGIRSSTKSIISLLLGIAHAAGSVPSLDTPFLDIFPEYRQTGMDPRKDSITLRHLLTMRGGFDYADGGRNSDVVAASSDWISSFMGLPLLFSPGERFSYASPQTHLLSAVISRSTGMSTEAYLDQELFGPLSISLRSWDTDPLGYHNGGTGMALTPRDMARIGELVLRRGLLDGQQIVPTAWLDSSFVPRNIQSVTWADLNAVNYGYQWWLNEEAGNELIFAAGFGGQFIFVIPQKDLVVVTTANTDVSLSVASVQEVRILNILNRYIIPAAS